MADYCHGNLDYHCCYQEGKVCPFLEEGTVPGRKWACGLYRELGDWSLVHEDPRYLEHVKPTWEKHGIDDCGDWRGTGEPQCCFAEDEV